MKISSINNDLQRFGHNVLVLTVVFLECINGLGNEIHNVTMFH